MASAIVNLDKVHVSPCSVCHMASGLELHNLHLYGLTSANVFQSAFKKAVEHKSSNCCFLDTWRNLAMTLHGISQ